jgi:hypothetical protein
MKACLLRVVFCALAVVVALIGLSFFTALLRGWSLHHKLLAATDGASTIKVIKHSDRLDPSFNPGKKYKEKIFRSVTLSTDQISQFRRALPVSSDYSVPKACAFVPHHRVEITRKDGGITVLEICFQCGAISLDARNSRSLPKGLERSLRDFVISLGMSPTLTREELNQL